MPHEAKIYLKYMQIFSYPKRDDEGFRYEACSMLLLYVFYILLMYMNDTVSVAANQMAEQSCPPCCCPRVKGASGGDYFDVPLSESAVSNWAKTFPKRIKYWKKDTNFSSAIEKSRKTLRRSSSRFKNEKYYELRD